MSIKVLIGIRGSGKSTWATKNRKDNEVIISRDKIRNTLIGKKKYLLNGHLENVISQMQDAQIQIALENNYNVIIDSTNLNYNYIKHLEKTFTKNLVFVFFDNPFWISYLRLVFRDFSIPKYLDKQYEKYNIIKYTINLKTHYECLVKKV